MPLYDCLLSVKPHVKKEAVMDLIARVCKHVYKRNGVVTDIKSFGTQQLAYGIRKLDGRHFQGQLMQITMMATPNINKELQYLNKEDRLLRWIVRNHRVTEYGSKIFEDEDDDDNRGAFSRLSAISSHDDDDDYKAGEDAPFYADDSDDHDSHEHGFDDHEVNGEEKEIS